MLLSLLVHAGIAATFVHAVRFKPEPLQLVRPIQVTLIEDYADAVGDGASESDSAGPGQQYIQVPAREEIEQTESPLLQADSGDRGFNRIEFPLMEEAANEPKTESIEAAEFQSARTAEEKAEVMRPTPLDAVNEAVSSLSKSIGSKPETAPSHDDSALHDEVSRENSTTESGQSIDIDPLPAEAGASIPDESESSMLSAEAPNDSTEQFAELTQHAGAQSVELVAEPTAAPMQVAPAAHAELPASAEPELAINSIDHQSDMTAPADRSVKIESSPPSSDMHDAPSVGSLPVEPAFKSSSDWDRLATALIPAADEIEEPGESEWELTPEPVTPADPAAFRQLESFVFDSEFERLTRTEQEHAASLETKTLSEPMIASAAYIPATADADWIAGILPSSENVQDAWKLREKPAEEVNAAEPVQIRPDAQLASISDFDAQVQQFAQSESDAVNSIEPGGVDSELAPSQVTISGSDDSRTPAEKSQVRTAPQDAKPDEVLLAKAEAPDSEADEWQKALKKPLLPDPPAAERRLPRSTAAGDAPPDSEQKSKRQAQENQAAPTQPEFEKISPVKQKTTGKSRQQASLGSASGESNPRYGIRGLPNPAPRYPFRSRANGEQGRVILQVVVDRRGRADEVTVIKSSGYSRLDKAARKAVSKWRFQPAQKDGRSARGTVQVPISFVLENS